MSKWFLDPRRPVTGGPQEEGLMPYIPELRISPHDMITYNHTLPRISAIYTAPTGLESACVVLVYGLGQWLFYSFIYLFIFWHLVHIILASEGSSEEYLD